MVYDDEPALLLAEHDREKPELVVNKDKVVVSLLSKDDENVQNRTCATLITGRATT